MRYSRASFAVVGINNKYSLRVHDNAAKDDKILTVFFIYDYVEKCGGKGH